MKQVYSHKQLLELRHERQNSEVKLNFHRKSLFLGSPQSKPHSSLWAYPVPANRNYAKLALSLKGRSDRNRQSERENRPDSKVSLMAAPIGISDLPIGSKIIKAAPGTPLPFNAVRVSFNEKHFDENMTPPRDSVRFRDPEVYHDQYKYGFDEVFWEFSEEALMESEMAGEMPEMGQATSAKVPPTGYYAPFFEQYIRRERVEERTEEAQSYDSESFAEDSSDSSNVQIQLPDLRV